MRSSSFLALLLFGVLGCKEPTAKKKSDVILGKSQCHYCKMIITNQKFGATIETKDGSHQHFGATECLAAHLLSKSPEVARLWTINHEEPTFLIDAQKAHYLRSKSKKMRSPMGLNIAGFQSREALQRAQKAHGGDVLDWDGVIELLKTTWFKSKYKKSATSGAK